MTDRADAIIAGIEADLNGRRDLHLDHLDEDILTEIREAWRKIIDGAQPAPQPNTVRVRIAVAVSPQGAWSASGWSHDTGEEAMREVRGHVGPHETIHYVTATLAIPQPPEPAEVEGEVEGA